MENSASWISMICGGLGMLLIILGIVWLYALAFSRGIGPALLCIVIPIALFAFITDEQGQKAWGSIAIGAILAFIGLVTS